MLHDRNTGLRIAGVAAVVILIALLGMTAYVDDLLSNINRVSYEDTIASGIEEAGEALGADVETGESGLSTGGSAEDETEAAADSDGESDGKADSATLDSALEAAESGTAASEEPAWTGETEVVKDKKVKNFLLIGQDRREDEDEQQRSDSMIICSMNMRTRKITLVSLMRDMYVPIPGYQSNRINASYALGGMKLLDETIEKNFGIHIDGNVEVDFAGFIDSMSEIGGLEMELTQEEADYINEWAKSGHAGDGTDTGSASEDKAAAGKDEAGKDTDEKNGAGSNDAQDNDDEPLLKEGLNTLTARQTLRYARMRYVGNGDYERTERQRKVLRAAYDKMNRSGLGTIIRIARHVLPNFTTDMSNRELFGYIFTVRSKDLTIAKKTYRLPADGAYSAQRINEMEVLVPDLQKNRELIKQYIYGIKPAGTGNTQGQ